MEITTEYIDVSKVCDAAKDECSQVLIIGLDSMDSFYFASSTSDLTQLLWWIEHFKLRLLSGEWSWDDEILTQEEPLSANNTL